jgi:hypothetical protein
MGKIFASYSLEKRLIFRIHKELKKFNIFNKWANDLNRQFTKVQVVNKHEEIFNRL